jgi:hypothetical protein
VSDPDFSDTGTPPANATDTPVPVAVDAPGYPDGTTYEDVNGAWVTLIYDYDASGNYLGWHKIPATAPVTGS